MFYVHVGVGFPNPSSYLKTPEKLKTMVDFRITFASSASTNPPIRNTLSKTPPYQGGIGSLVDVNIFF